MLDGEARRQDELKARLASDPETAAWIDDTHVFQNYKQLQFFDTLALYFNCVQPSERGEACFAHVPMNATEDTNVDVVPVAETTYAFDPYPFDEDGIDLAFDGRYLAPSPSGDDVRDALEAAPVATQHIRLVAQH